MEKKSSNSQNLAQEILEFYDAILDRVKALREETKKTIIGFQKEQEELSTKLRENLAKGESLRKKDFGSLMEGIIAGKKRREAEVEEMLARFQKEEEEMVQGLKKLLGKDKKVRIKDLKNWLISVKQGQEERTKEIDQIKAATSFLRKTASEMIGSFKEEREEMLRSWQELTEKMREKRKEKDGKGHT